MYGYVGNGHSVILHTKKLLLQALPVYLIKREASLECKCLISPLEGKSDPTVLDFASSAVKMINHGEAKTRSSREKRKSPQRQNKQP